jgi:hypothetical protein
VLKNSFALSSASEAGAENDVFVVFWPCFGPLLDRRPGRQRLFQQCPMALAGPPRSHENGFVAWLTSALIGAIHTRERARSTV